MWRLKVGEGGKDTYIFSTNNFVGRQTWEFHGEEGTQEERDEVEAARRNFSSNRSCYRACGDRLWRFQVSLSLSLSLYVCVCVCVIVPLI